MECLIVLKTVDIVESTLPCVKRSVKTYSPVETDNKEIESVKDAKACANSYRR